MSETTLDSVKNWFKLFALGSVIVFCSMVLLSWAFIKWQKNSDEESRIERSMEICRQDNLTQERSRAFAREQLVQVFSIFSSRDLTPKEIETELKREFDIFENFVLESFPYRMCTEKCVIAFSNPDLDKCPPAISVKGEVPVNA